MQTFWNRITTKLLSSQNVFLDCPKQLNRSKVGCEFFEKYSLRNLLTPHLSAISCCSYHFLKQQGDVTSALKSKQKKKVLYLKSVEKNTRQANMQCGQITGSDMCSGSSTVLPDLVKFSFVLYFMDTWINFWRSILSQIFTEHVMRYKIFCKFLIMIYEVHMLISITN